MLYLNIVKACNNKGIKELRRWLVKNGFSHVAAGWLKTMSPENIEAVQKFMEGLALP